MLIQLRKDETPRPGGSSSGFEGAERLDLLKNVHVVIRDVGNSGIMPVVDCTGAQAPRRSAGAKIQIASGSGQEKSQAAQPDEPTPLDLSCDSKMQVFLPKPQAAGRRRSPRARLPTLVQFDRNVVVLRGQLDDRPDQLTCDTLKLEPGSRREAHTGSDVRTNQELQPRPLETWPGTAARLSRVPGPRPTPTACRWPSPSPPAALVSHSEPASADAAGETEKKGLFGDLTLQRVHATGHAVWLYLPAEGVKLRCNELIHVRQAPYKPDKTYFRGDVTRPLDLEKIDVVQEGPDQGKVSSVTHIRTVDATLLDSGNGMDTADVVATAPAGSKPSPTAISRSSASPSGRTSSSSRTKSGLTASSCGRSSTSREIVPASSTSFRRHRSTPRT